MTTLFHQFSFTTFFWNRYALDYANAVTEVRSTKDTDPFQTQFDLIWLIDEGVCIMAQRNTQSNGWSSNVEFIDFYLSEDDITHFQLWSLNNDHEIDNAVRDTFSKGYRLSTRFDEFNACYLSSMSTQDRDNPNFGKILTGRSDDWFEAQLLILFKHRAIFKGDAWSSPKRSLRSWG